VTDDVEAEAASQARRAAAAARREIVRLRLPSWLRTVGTGSWLVLGVVALLLGVVLLLALVTQLLIPLIIAAVLAAILVPVVDRLQGWHVPRWLGATLLLLAGLSIVAIVMTIVIRGIVSHSAEIWTHVSAGVDEVGGQVDPGSQPGPHVVAVAQQVLRGLSLGLVGSLFSSATILIVGTTLALFMLLFLLKDWAPITIWTAGHVGLPQRLGDQVLEGTVRAFRDYALGLTVIGIANGVVVGVGALILGVPLAGTIALVSFVTAYVPYFGAFVAGAFAVLVALGSNGLADALVMLAIVLLANNTIQNLLEPFAFGRSLRLHPLVILIVTTAGTLLFGLMGAILAAPLTAATVNASRVLRDAGVFDEREASVGPDGSQIEDA
jgi:predicted PurR-regulated permease PerM